MPAPTTRAAIEGARAALVRERAALTSRIQEDAEKSGTLRKVERSSLNLDAAREARNAAAALLASQRHERSLRGNLQEAIGNWLSRGVGEGALTAQEDLARLNALTPIVLFPVRIETRFSLTPGDPHLNVRVYLDRIFFNTNEPALTPTEEAAGKAYYEGLDDNGAHRGAEVEKNLWRNLVARFDASRAAWIVRAMSPERGAGYEGGVFVGGQTGALKFPSDVGSRPDVWTRPAEAVLPDRWVVLAFRSGQKVIEFLGGPIVEPLALTPDPLAPDTDFVSVHGLKIDPDIAWTVDFDRAVAAGMGIRVPLLDLPDRGQLGFDRLIVVGVKTSMDGAASSLLLQNLFDAHHYTSGLALVDQGTPTNNTKDRPSGFPSKDPNALRSLEVERMVPPYRGDRRLPTVIGDSGDLTPDDDGARVANFLGLSTRVLLNVAGARTKEQVRARAMNEALWPILGYFMEQMMSPVFPLEDIERARLYFRDFVRGRGPASALRIGETPYGLLPVLSLTLWQSEGATQGDRGQIESKMIGTLRTLREVWRTAVDAGEKVPRITPGSSDREGDFYRVLRMNASTCEVFLRQVLGVEAIYYYQQLSGLPWTPWQNALKTIGSVALGRIGHLPDWNPSLVRMMFEETSQRFKDPLVATPPLSEDKGLSEDYVKALVESPIMALNARDPMLRNEPALGAPLLHLLLRHAALLEYWRILVRLLPTEGATAGLPKRRTERELWEEATRSPETVWDVFARTVGNVRLTHPNFMPGVDPGTTLAELVFHDPEAVAYREFLTQLIGVPTAELERLSTETMDITSHRLDAWITALATRRLRDLRSIEVVGDDLPPGASESYFGGYGWVENLRPVAGPTAPVRGGFIHAPSMAHAAAAGVLRSGYLSRSGAGAEAYAIDLSSARVRAGRRILAELRNGQPLGALVGYDFERGLHEQRLDKYVNTFRNLYPLVADKREDSGGDDKEAIAARNVVDGLALRKAFAEREIPTGVVDPGDQSRVDAIVAALNNSIDGLADLMTAESVFQVVRGNTVSAAATLDSLARGSLAPLDPEIGRTTRGGTALTHRVMLLLPGISAPALPAWPASDKSPRAKAEPSRNAWVGALLGDPARVECAVKHHDGTSTTVTLANLEMSPLDVIALAKTVDKRDQDTILNRRILSSGGLPRDKQHVGIDYTAAEANGITFPQLMELAQSIAALMGRARPLRPEDCLTPADAARGGVVADMTDIKERARQALEGLTGVKDLLESVTDTTDIEDARGALVEASFYIVHSAYPPPEAEASTLVAMTRSILTDIERRRTGAATWSSVADDPTKSQAERVDARLRILPEIFGRDFVSLPVFNPPGADELGLAVQGSSALLDIPTGVPDELKRKLRRRLLQKFLQRAARTRPGVKQLQRVFLYGNALGSPPPQIDVLQLPHVLEARWAGLHFAQDQHPVPGRLSIVLLRGAQTDEPVPTENWRGLLVDEWLELIPNKVEQTGVAFHYDTPGAEAPQTVLVAVRSGTGPAWDFNELVTTLQETLDLAKIRAVDTELLGDIRQLVPTAFLAYNPDGKTVSTSFVDRRVSPLDVIF
jgi:hypothetical protein